jgi:hypothetical protein
VLVIEAIFGFDFYAAELSLEKFHNVLNGFCVGSRGVNLRENHRQKDERMKHSCWPAHALPLSRKFLPTAPRPRKQQSGETRCFFGSSRLSCQRSFKVASATTAHSTHKM